MDIHEFIYTAKNYYSDDRNRERPHDLFEEGAMLYWQSLSNETLENLDSDDRKFIETKLWLDGVSFKTNIANSLTHNEIKIATPPGIHLLRFTELVFSTTSQEQIFKPLVADWHVEYFEALDQKRGLLKFFFISARHCLSFFWTVVLSFRLDSLLKAARRIFTN